MPVDMRQIGPYGIAFYGTDATLVVDRGGYGILLKAVELLKNPSHSINVTLRQPNKASFQTHLAASKIFGSVGFQWFEERARSNI